VRPKKDDAHFAILCSPNGEIARVLRQGGPFPADQPGVSSVFQVVAAGSDGKCRRMLAELAATGSLADWDLNLTVRDGIVAFRVSGVLLADEFLLFGSTAEELYGGFTRLNSDLVTMQRQAVQRNADLEARVAERTTALQNANSALHGELAGRRRAEEQLRLSEEQRTQLLHRVLTAQEEERARIATELHDRVGQELTALLVGLRTVEQAVADADAEAEATVAALRTQTASTLEDVRRIAFDMRPSDLDDLGIEVALARDIDSLAQGAGLEPSFTVHNPDGMRLPAAAETCLYRVIHASLTNVVHHANATSVGVYLTVTVGAVSALIEDDGVGFDVASTSAGPVEERFGLVGMEERVRMLGGEFTVESQEGEGTGILIEIPLA